MYVMFLWVTVRALGALTEQNYYQIILVVISLGGSFGIQ